MTTTDPKFIPVIKKPTKLVVLIAAGLAWGNDPDYLYQEKLDGRFSTREWRGHAMAGEQMRGGEFVAFDLLSTEGCDCRPWTAASRWGKLNILAREGLPWPIVKYSAHGGELLSAVLTAGGEGIVRKHINATWYDAMTAAKRLETWHCRIIAFNGGTQSVQIADAITGEPRGNVPLRGGKCDMVRVGTTLKVEGFGLTTAGKIREPRVCSDTPTSWLVKY